MANGTLVLHIGATKTGSSALQSHLYSNRGVLEANGVFYPDVGVASGAHHQLFAAIHPSAWAMHGFSDRQSREAVFFDMAEEIVRSAVAKRLDTILLSSEYLWGVFADELYRKVRDAFAGYSIVIVGAVRRIDYWVEASYIQAAKGREVREFSDWLPIFSSSPESGFNYYKVFTKWEEGVGASDVRVVPYEPNNAATFLTSISEVLLGEAVVRSLPVPTVRKDNPSLTKEGVRLIQELHKSHLSEADMKKGMSKVFSEHTRSFGLGDIYFMSTSERVSLLKSMVPYNQQLLKRYMPERDYLFNELWPS